MSEWRRRQTQAQTRGRTIERQADGIRQELVRLASGEGEIERLLFLVAGIQEQLRLAQALAMELADSRPRRGQVLTPTPGKPPILP